MSVGDTFDVDPAFLHLPGARQDGADPTKLHRQLLRNGTSVAGMPPVEVMYGSDGEMVIFDGVTRATRVAKYLPGVLIPVEVTGRLAGPVGNLPLVGDRI